LKCILQESRKTTESTESNIPKRKHDSDEPVKHSTENKREEESDSKKLKMPIKLASVNGSSLDKKSSEKQVEISV
jgi:K+-transporting ATPase c subunit